MVCKSCRNTITPGMEIVVDELSREWAHCPYCLHLFKTETMSPEVESNGTARRDEMRRNVRKRFVARLTEQSRDGRLNCPVCSHNLNKNDEQLLLNNEHFKCPLCSYDLAAFAYREDAYHEQRWVPVVYTLSDLLEKKECEGCSHFRAAAKACQKAFSWMPGLERKIQSQLKGLSHHSAGEETSCNWESCVAIKQYRKLAGEGLLLL